MGRYVIDGLFLMQQITGIQRYAYEIVMELDKLVKQGEIQILIPKSAEGIPKYKNIEIVKFGKHKGIAWEQIDLKKYLKRKNAQGIFLCNSFPLDYPYGIIVIHDVGYKVNPKFYRSLRDKVSMFWHRLNYYLAFHSDMKIVTVSEFSKSEIIKYYDIESKRITVINNSWQHMEKVGISETIFKKFRMLTKKNYYFSMSTLAANKNLKWILYAAKNNPRETFVIAGGGRLKGAAEAMGFVHLQNVHFLGYVSDEDAKMLMANCKAFLFPSFYEGFGIPPLEAIACGCKRVIVSDTPCMHEVYGEYAEYVNPFDYMFCISDDNTSNNVSNILNNYSWEKSAKGLYSIMTEKNYKLT
ncbi:MAG: glycosyltransferase family 4 protein [Alistipes sp.]|nr:glycosyltransferase family 4 protein [Alistipes sp.]